MNIDKTCFILVICILTIIYMIYLNVSKELTVKSYVVTNYMYIFTALLLYVLTQHILDKNNFEIRSHIFIAILTFLVLFGIVLTQQNEQLMIHSLWVIFIVLISILTYSIYKLAKHNNIIWKVLITIGVMFFVMSYIAYTQQPGTFKPWGSYLMMGLLTLIIFELVDLIFANTASQEFSNRIWWYSVITIILFNGFLLYDTQNLVIDGNILEKECRGKNHLNCANYPVKSLDIFLDLLNLFSSTTNIYSNK
jgi:FtsH-binding integral membrane protein